jgi:hypothetical protein
MTGVQSAVPLGGSVGSGAVGDGDAGDPAGVAVGVPRVAVTEGDGVGEVDQQPATTNASTSDVADRSDRLDRWSMTRILARPVGTVGDHDP